LANKARFGKRGEQYLYLNQRYINDKSLNHAIIAAYGEILAHGGFPFYAVFLQVDPGRVDVNVHPSKMEVKFADDRLIYAILRNAVRHVLSSVAVVLVETTLGHAIPEMSWSPMPESPAPGSEAPPLQLTPPSNFRVQHPGRQLGFNLPPPPPSVQTIAPALAHPSAEPTSELVAQDFGPQIWQIHHRYICRRPKPV
jgi:hypothetical protein